MPDRVAMFSYAHVPWLRKQQGAFATHLPEGREKFHIFRAGLERFLGAGYHYIGMDHFARPTTNSPSPSAIARCIAIFRATPPKPAPTFTAWASAPSARVGDTYAQNRREVAEYRTAVAARGIATMRGYRFPTTISCAAP